MTEYEIAKLTLNKEVSKMIEVAEILHAQLIPTLMTMEEGEEKESLKIKINQAKEEFEKVKKQSDQILNNL